MVDTAKVIITKGLPASGKSTWAKEQVKRRKDVKRVNKDDLRAMLDMGRYTQENEKFILDLRNHIIIKALARGFDVIVDDTNLHPKHERAIRALVGPNVKVEVKWFNVDVEECIKRDKQRIEEVGEKVIRRMWDDWNKRWKDQDCSVPDPKPVEGVYVPDPDLPSAIIVDIDGTLATTDGKRGFFDWKKVGGDSVIEPTAEIVRHYYNDLGYAVILFSGRDSVCRQETIDWLYDNNIPYNELFMRTENDTTKDAIVKEELFDKHIVGNYNVKFCIDDRRQVKDMWVAKGLYVLDVNQHSEIF